MVWPDLKVKHYSVWYSERIRRRSSGEKQRWKDNIKHGTKMDLVKQGQLWTK